ncbi:MAG TPA: ice-binding family protein [Candidatus Saccharimonadales bacterium]|jgi:hypothetical protein
MKSLRHKGILAVFLGVFLITPVLYAAPQPNLGTTNTYSVLAGSYTNTAIGTVINGDLGYTTPPAVAPTVSGNTHVANAAYNQAGIDQASALSELNSQPCTFTFPAGAKDLAIEAPFGNVGEYTPGVYCIDGAVSIGGGGTITLNGAGVYIFRSTGALSTSANSIVTATGGGGASACNLFWTPGAATTLGASSTFIGTIINPAGITVGSTVNWTGRALAFGGTVATTTDTINTVPVCSAASAPAASTTASGTNAAAATATTTSKTPGLPNSGGGAPAASLPLWAAPVAVIAFLSSASLVVRKRI